MLWYIMYNYEGKKYTKLGHGNLNCNSQTQKFFMQTKANK